MLFIRTKTLPAILSSSSFFGGGGVRGGGGGNPLYQATQRHEQQLNGEQQ